MKYDISERQLTIDSEAVSPRGVYTILQGVDVSLRELRDTQSETSRRTDTRLTQLAEEVSGLKEEVTSLKVAEGVTQHKISALEDDVRELRRDIKELHGDIREIAGGFTMMQTRLNWWLVIAGLVIAALQLWRA